MKQDITNTEGRNVKEIKEDASCWTVVKEDGTIIIQTKEDKIELGVNTSFLTTEQQDNLLSLIKLIKKHNPHLRPDQVPLVDAFARAYMLMTSSTAIIAGDLARTGQIDPKQFNAYNTVMNKLKQFADVLLISPNEVNKILGGVALPKDFDGNSVLTILQKTVVESHDKKIIDVKEDEIVDVEVEEDEEIN